MENNTLKQIFLLMGVAAMSRGTIRCCKCHKALQGPVCFCGHTACYISIYWKGKQYRFFRYYVDNELFDYRRALKQLLEMNLSIEKKEFNPIDWTTHAIKERRFEHQVEKWLEQKKEEMGTGERAPETIRTYESYLKNHFLGFFKRWDVREIHYEQLENFKDWLGKRVSINTRKRIIGALHAFFKWMWRKGIIKEFPVWPIVEGEDVVKKAIDYESQGELLKLLPDKHRDIYEFGFETGLRPNELCAIQVCDTDIINSRALIQHGYSGSKLQERTKGKNKKWIPLSTRAHEIAIKNIKDKLPQAFLFINLNTGKGYTLKTLDNMWSKHVGRKITHYEASRHSFCTQIAESGANLLQAKELMRHKDTRSTEQYFHATTDKLRDIVNRRGKVIPIERVLNEPSAVSN
jgi:integrase